MPTRSSSRKTRSGTRNRRRPARNRRRFSLRRLLWPLVAAVVVSGLGAGCYYLLTCPQLRVTAVDVRGTRLLSRAAVEADARPALGQNILILSKHRIRMRVMRHPEVADVTIGRVLPGTVVVKVRERAPRLVLSNGSGLWLADASGLPFHRVRSPQTSIPLVTLPPGAHISAGKPPKHDSVASALACLRDCRVLGCRVRKISVDQSGNICLNMGSDFYVKLGQPVEIPEKLETLSKLLSANPGVGDEVLYIDVSCSERPVWQPRSEIRNPKSEI